MLDVACSPDTSGHCERSESGGLEHEFTEEGTLEDCSWYFRFHQDFVINI